MYSPAPKTPSYKFGERRYCVLSSLSFFVVFLSIFERTCLFGGPVSRRKIGFVSFGSRRRSSEVSRNARCAALYLGQFFHRGSIGWNSAFSFLYGMFGKESLFFVFAFFIGVLFLILFFTSDIQSTTPLRLRIRKSFIFPKVE